MKYTSGRISKEHSKFDSRMRNGIENKRVQIERSQEAIVTYNVVSVTI